MVFEVFLTNVRRLLHNRVELVLTFVVPIAFFSVFAVIFGGGVGSGATPKLRVVITDDVQSPQSEAVFSQLEKGSTFRLMNEGESKTTLTREECQQLVRRGNATLAIRLQEKDGRLHAEILSDASDQIAGQVASAVVSKTLLVVDAKQRMSASKSITQHMPLVVADTTPQYDPAPEHAPAAEVDPAPEQAGDIASPVELVDVMAKGKSNPVVSMYAAGIAVMFLLFGATSGGGALLEERENRTLDRLLSTKMTMDHLILGKWFYLSAIGVLQVSVMFVWAQIVFGVDLLGHLDGFLMMTVVTASAASAFGLLLATLCKTRGQLNGLSVILVLTMSALGGSMVPRYVMSESLQEIGLWTFNAWALDGYNKVFWRDLPAASLAPQLAVLLTTAIVLLVTARVLAISWERE